MGRCFQNTTRIRNKNGIVYDMNQRGPILGAGFKF
jgi:hypothetical protein